MNIQLNTEIPQICSATLKRTKSEYRVVRMCKDGRKKSPNISLIITVRCANANAHVCCRFELRDKERDDVGDEVMLWVIVLRHLGGRFVGLFLLRRQRRDVYCLYPSLALNYRSAYKTRGTMYCGYTIISDRCFIWENRYRIYFAAFPGSGPPTKSTPDICCGMYPHNPDNIVPAGQSVTFSEKCRFYSETRRYSSVWTTLSWRYFRIELMTPPFCSYCWLPVILDRIRIGRRRRWYMLRLRNNVSIFSVLIVGRQRQTY